MINQHFMNYDGLFRNIYIYIYIGPIKNIISQYQ
jgi:hypothetical protein